MTCSVQQHVHLIQLMLVGVIKAGRWHCCQLVQQQAPGVSLARLYKYSQRPKQVCYLLWLEPACSSQAGHITNCQCATQSSAHNSKHACSDQTGTSPVASVQRK